MQQLTNEEIIAGNKLIAKFMGYEKVKNTSNITDDRNELWLTDITGAVSQGLPQFDLSWDLLMPVVEKIIEIDITPAPNWTGYRIEIIPRGYVKIAGFPMPPITTNVAIEGSLINAVYKAVIQFIQWHNTLNTNNNG